MPRYSKLEISSGDLTLVKLKDLTADLIMLLHRGKPVLAIVVEVQLRRDRAKERSWPAYLASLHSRHGCDVILVVVTPSRAVAQWAAVPIRLGPGFQLTPLVLGPDTIPVLKGRSARSSLPEFTVLSSVSHPADHDAAVAAFDAIKGLPAEQATLYFELILSSVTKKLRKHFEDLMASDNFAFDNPLRRKYRTQALAEGEAKGKAEGEAKGKAEGEAKGKAEGEAKGKAEAILAVLGARNLRTTKAQRTKVCECTELKQLNTWLTRAATCSSATEVFAD